MSKTFVLDRVGTLGLGVLWNKMSVGDLRFKADLHFR